MPSLKQTLAAKVEAVQSRVAPNEQKGSGVWRGLRDTVLSYLLALAGRFLLERASCRMDPAKQTQPQEPVPAVAGGGLQNEPKSSGQPASRR